MSDTADTTDTTIGAATDPPQGEGQSTASVATTSPPDNFVPEAEEVRTSASTTVPGREDEVSTPTQSNPFPVPPSADQAVSSDGGSPSDSPHDEEESPEKPGSLATLTPAIWDEIRKSQAAKENENAADPTGQSSEPNTPADDHPAA